MKEFELIAKLQRRFGKPQVAVELGVGDDAAVVAVGGGRRWALTTDALVEWVHFRRTFGTPRLLGRKALAINLSDLAAMGADPRHALIALGLPDDLDEAFVDELFDGLEELAGEHRVSVIGGNLSRSPVISLTVTAIGDLAGPPLIRGGGSPGERLVVTGPLGSAALGRHLLELAHAPEDDDEEALVRRHLDPTPRVGAGQALRLIATAGIDISDGLAQDAGHLAESSHCAARLELARLPLSPAYHRLTAAFEDRWAPALAGGEDYELLLAIPPTLLHTAQLTANQAGVQLFEVGELVQGRGVAVIDERGEERPAPQGWQHF